MTTVLRRLLAAGRKARRPIKKQLLTTAMCKKRLVWAKTHANWTIEDWKNVMFTFGKFYYYDYSNKIFVWRNIHDFYVLRFIFNII